MDLRNIGILPKHYVASQLRPHAIQVLFGLLSSYESLLQFFVYIKSTSFL
jgi:hypothetical protein